MTLEPPSDLSDGGFLVLGVSSFPIGPIGSGDPTMSKTVTASERSSLIRLASTLPKGSEERRAILSGLKEAAGVGVTGTMPLSGKLTVKRNGAVLIELDRISGLDLDKYEGMGSMGSEMAAGLAGALEGSKVEWARPHGNGKVSFALS